MSRETLQDIINDFSPGKFTKLFRDKNRSFTPQQESFNQYNDENFIEGVKLGEIIFSASERLVVCAFSVVHSLSERSGKKAQYEKGKKILKDIQSDAGIFIFYDKSGNFRLSLIYPQYYGTKRTWNNFRRFTYFVSKEFANKTFLIQIGLADFANLDKIKEAFSIAKVTDDFYKEFMPKFEKIAHSVRRESKEADADQKSHDFALLFVIRIIFLGFIQKRGWLGEDEKFLQNFLHEYNEKNSKKDKFYKEWLKPLFFEALNSPIGRKVAYGNNEFSKETEKRLQMAPYLNGGLFHEKEIDTEGYTIPDKIIQEFFDFLFSYNFTIEENTLYDEDLELNPEFLGIIFERLVNKADGAVYTPRTEVDLMCRLALVKWLEQNVAETVKRESLYELFFREGGVDESFEPLQKQGIFNRSEIDQILSLLENITICDPAVGSGAFPVGMLHILDEVEERLRTRVGRDEEITRFERKKRIINQSLYGVEVKEWAVWITQLRLWTTLFIDAPDKMKQSLEPILPSLDFKIRKGDSLVQRIGTKTFPVSGHADIPETVKKKITQLKGLKTDYFQNKVKNAWEIKQKEFGLFKEILLSEIAEKKKKIAILKGMKPNQQLSLFNELEIPEQKELSFNKDKIDVLEIEITELEEELSSLREDKPLVWNIEFAEIFSDKGGFDIVIGNPPYVRQEDIADPTFKIQDAKAYRSLLIEMVKLDFPQAFRREKQINAQSDLYTYFYVRGLRLLNKNGFHVFICSNSWLDAGYGAWLQEFLLNNCQICFIIDNHAKRSFAAADINTIISVISVSKKKEAENKQIKFIAFKTPFDEVVYTENLLEIETTRIITSNERYRTYPITAKELLRAGKEYFKDDKKNLDVGKYIGDKWGGKYLRAPDIFFTIFNKGKEYIDKLGNYFDGERYLNTGGADNFFILTTVEQKNKTYSKIFNGNTKDGNDDNFGGEVENKYLIPLIKDYTKKEKRIKINNYDARCVVIMNEDKSDKIINYIKWGEKNDYNKRSVTKLQTPWYKPTRQMLDGAEILVPRSFNDTFVIYYNPNKFLSLRFYRLHIKKGRTEELLSFLNSTMFWLIFEALGNKNLGQGALDFYMEDLLNLRMPVILSTKLEKSFAKVSSREIKPIFEECGFDKNRPIRTQEPKPLADRKELDDIIFDILNLTKGERNEIYWAVCELVKNRIEKAKSV